MSTLKKVLLGVILLTAVAVSGVHFFDLPHIAKAETNAAPPFTVTDMNGQTVSLASLKVSLFFLNFWATWCLPVLEKCLISKECMLNMEIKFILLSST